MDGGVWKLAEAGEWLEAVGIELPGGFISFTWAGRTQRLAFCMAWASSQHGD